MPETKFMKAEHACAEAALRAGCKFLAGYPITPMIEMTEHFVNNAETYGASIHTIESEVEGGNILLGVAATGNRAMAASTGVGVSLMSETLSQMASYGMPYVFAHWGRQGPGSGGLALSQGDYFQATKAAGQGDFQLIVLAPNSVQEVVDMTFEAFDIAEELHCGVNVFADYNIALSTEVVTLPDPLDLSERPLPEWAISGERDRPKRVTGMGAALAQGGVSSGGAKTVAAEEAAAEFTRSERMIWDMFDRYAQLEPRAEEYLTTDAEVVVTAFGSVSRIARFVVDKMRAEGKAIGMIRPQTLYPFPKQAFQRAAEHGTRGVLTLECSTGQMVEDVRLAVEGQMPVEFYGRVGGAVPSLEEVESQIEKLRTRLVG